VLGGRARLFVRRDARDSSPMLNRTGILDCHKKGKIRRFAMRASIGHSQDSFDNFELVSVNVRFSAWRPL